MGFYITYSPENDAANNIINIRINIAIVEVKNMKNMNLCYSLVLHYDSCSA